MGGAVANPVEMLASGLRRAGLRTLKTYRWVCRRSSLFRITYSDTADGFDSFCRSWESLFGCTPPYKLT